MNLISKLSTLSTTALTVVVVSYAGSASAISFTLNGTSGSWSNVQGAPGTFEQVGNESQVLWGNPVNSADRSGLGFTGVGANEINLKETFKLGTLRHFNNRVFEPTAESVDLSIDVDLVGFGLNTVDLTTNIDETPNVAGNCQYDSIVPCSDLISLEGAFGQSETFYQNGMGYALKLFGFEIVEGNKINRSSWTTEENAISEVHLLGSIIKVPEPTVLAGLSLLGVYFATGRRKRNI